jgi:FdhD protein
LAVSAPSSMAVEVCNEKGITLIAFCRENRATVYTNQQHVISPRSLQKW